MLKAFFYETRIISAAPRRFSSSSVLCGSFIAVSLCFLSHQSTRSTSTSFFVHQLSLCGVLPGAVGQSAVVPSVNYPPPVCAVKGSTVTLPCTFTPLQSVDVDGRKVPIEIVRVRWCQKHLICHGSTPTVYDSDSTTNDPRYKYLGDKKGNCTLQITDIREEDEETFVFRMEANDSSGHWTGRSGVRVSVSEGDTMKITSSSSDGQVRTGESVTLFCSARCTFHQLKVTWFRDNCALSESGPALQLSSPTAKDSGNYTCGLQTSTKTRSGPYSLQVEAGQEGLSTSSLCSDTDCYTCIM
uniref:Ig-like domain-containing protein n=1 Tax=Sparus aurata TaxID=8175 RepID=A0A671TVL3_SPAAU